MKHLENFYAFFLCLLSIFPQVCEFYQNRDAVTFSSLSGKNTVYIRGRPITLECMRNDNVLRNVIFKKEEVRDTPKEGDSGRRNGFWVAEGEGEQSCQLTQVACI
jgi:hypothetical protein